MHRAGVLSEKRRLNILAADCCDTVMDMNDTSRALVLLSAFIVACPSLAQDESGGAAVDRYLVRALVTDAYDGDTLTVEAALWPDLTWSGSVRVLGVDTPEIRGACDEERERALAARDYVHGLLIDETVALAEIENDRYGGRVLAKVFFREGGTDLVILAERLIELGYGRAYDGGTRESWCANGETVGGTENGEEEVEDPYSDPEHPLSLYDDNRNGRISCAEARAHGIAPVFRGHPAYEYMSDPDGDGVVCE